MEHAKEYNNVIEILNNRHYLYRRSVYRNTAWDEGFIYVADFWDKIKIGRSEQPKKRIKSLEATNKHKVLNSYITPLIYFHKLFEKKCHEEFFEDNIKWEYFKWDFDDIVKRIKWLEDNYIEHWMFISLMQTLPELRETIIKLELEIEDLDNRYRTRINKLSYECMKDWLFKEIRKNLTKEQIIKLLSE